MDNQLQNDEMYLPGPIGTAQIGGRVSDITAIEKRKDGSVTLTITPRIQQLPPSEATEDINHEPVPPKQLNQ